MPQGGKGGWEACLLGLLACRIWGADLDNWLPRESKPWMKGGRHVEQVAEALERTGVPLLWMQPWFAMDGGLHTLNFLCFG